MEVINAVGRRKQAIARVYLSDGKGNITINERDFKEYFGNPILQYIVEQPLNLMEVAGKYDIQVNLDGGGVKGQAEALRLAITRALIKIDENNKPKLKAAGFTTRDPRL
ncbi:MAG TPA: 30S ribosomal protein S9, partial [Bacteroidales bacterium]|nr:30S ribosomal protein S9 [Bacteroidales bacterium]